MENVNLRYAIQAAASDRPPSQRIRFSDRCARQLKHRTLIWLAVFIHLLTAAALSVAAAFTCVFLLVATFWDGVMIGVLLYGVIMIGASLCEDIDETI